MILRSRICYLKEERKILRRILMYPHINWNSGRQGKDSSHVDLEIETNWMMTKTGRLMEMRANFKIELKKRKGFYN